jgi:hypothetical protein
MDSKWISESNILFTGKTLMGNTWEMSRRVKSSVESENWLIKEWKSRTLIHYEGGPGGMKL